MYTFRTAITTSKVQIVNSLGMVNKKVYHIGKVVVSRRDLVQMFKKVEVAKILTLL